MLCSLSFCPAGTGLKEAVSLLEGMLNDNTDFVRQGASIAMALVLLQQPESVVEPFRKKVRRMGVTLTSNH
jgi:26S proteasome regulatory subunit N2